MIEESKITIAIIAAASAIGGAFISSMFSLIRESLEKSHKRKVLLREKYEEMAYLTISAQEWLGHVTNANNISELSSMPPVDARRALVLANIYFPKMREATQDILNASVDFQHMLIDNHEFVSGKTVGVQAAHKNAVAFEEAADNYYKAIRALDDATTKFAIRYAKA